MAALRTLGAQIIVDNAVTLPARLRLALHATPVPATNAGGLAPWPIRRRQIRSLVKITRPR
jgi:hypothetical protein